MFQFDDKYTVGLTAYRVNSRFFCATNSPTIGFMTESYTRNIPLYAVGNNWGILNPLESVVFMAELNGYLLFEDGASVKIIELDEYKRSEFMPQTVTKAKFNHYPSFLYSNLRFNGNDNLPDGSMLLYYSLDYVNSYDYQVTSINVKYVSLPDGGDPLTRLDRVRSQVNNLIPTWFPNSKEYSDTTYLPAALLFV